MTNAPILNDHLRNLLDTAVARTVATINGLAANQSVFLPNILLEKAGKHKSSIIIRGTNTEALNVARETIQKAKAVDAYVLSYSVQQRQDDGTMTSGIMLEIGEKGQSFNYRYVQPFRRTATQVELLTDKPVAIGKIAALI
jgi:hypothetical protein